MYKRIVAQQEHTQLVRATLLALRVVSFLLRCVGSYLSQPSGFPSNSSRGEAGGSKINKIPAKQSSETQNPEMDSLMLFSVGAGTCRSSFETEGSSHWLLQSFFVCGSYFPFVHSALCCRLLPVQSLRCLERFNFMPFVLPCLLSIILR